MVRKNGSRKFSKTKSLQKVYTREKTTLHWVWFFSGDEKFYFEATRLSYHRIAALAQVKPLPNEARTTMSFS